MNDKQRLDFVAELVRLPTASFHFQDDEAMAEAADMPLGYTIRVDESCLPAVEVSASTFRRVLDSAKRVLDKADKE